MVAVNEKQIVNPCVNVPIAETKLIYVAAPYNDPDPAKVQERMDIVTYELAKFASMGSVAFSPLLIHFCLNTGIKLPSDYKFWENFCLAMLRRSDELVVLTTPGYEESSGVQAEITFAKEVGIPIRYLAPLKSITP